MEKQRRAFTKSGPHPHHQLDEPTSLRQVTQAVPRGGSFYQSRQYYENPRANYPTPSSYGIKKKSSYYG